MKLFVTQVVNGNMTVVSEKNNDPQGAKVAFHSTATSLWNAVDVTEAELKILDEQMNTYEDFDEHITHAVVEGYLHDGKFYANYNKETEKYTDEIEGRNDTLYIDLTEGQNRKKYKWNGSAFVAV